MKKVVKKRTNWKRKFYASDLIRSAMMRKVIEVKKELDLMDNAHSALLACYNEVSERARSLEKHNAILLQAAANECTHVHPASQDALCEAGLLKPPPRWQRLKERVWL